MIYPLERDTGSRNEGALRERGCGWYGDRTGTRVRGTTGSY